MVSLSTDESNEVVVHRKSKFLPQFVRRLGIGKNKTVPKNGLDSEDDVYLRKKIVSFESNAADAVTAAGGGGNSCSSDRPSSLPLLVRHNDMGQLCDGREEKAISLGNETGARRTSILKTGGYQVTVIDEGRDVCVRTRSISRQTEDFTNSSGNESSSSPFRRGTSFRQSFNYLFKRNKQKLKDRSCTSDSDSNAVLELDEETDTNTPSKPFLDAFLPEKMPSKRASTGDIFDDIVIQLNEDFGVKNRGKSHRRMHSDSMCIGRNAVSSNAVQSDRSTSSVGLGFRPLPISSTIEPLSSDVQIPANSQLSRSPSHNNSTKSDQKSLKSLTSSPLSVSPTIRSSSPYPSKSVAKNDAIEKSEKPEKEKKKKEYNSSRQKKFSRHFIQVEDEKVLNYFSCALISDILLQGHLYVTQNYFAFYSNVFGYVTKLLIPTVSVIKISKEKTAKMFPNAVGVTTCDDRHVFGSFMSREAAYRLMCSVWRPVAPIEMEEPTAQKLPDVEVSECSVEDDSSCSISGNESSSQVKDKKSDVVDSGDSNDKLTVIDGIKRSLDVTILDVSKSIKSVQKEIIIKAPAALIASAAILKTSGNATLREKPSFSDNPYQSSSSSTSNANTSILTRLRNRLQQIFPSDFGVIHVGIILAIVLALFSCFLMYKIHYLQSRIYSFNNFRWGEDENMDVYAEVLRWQKQMQDRSTEEAQIVLNSNLEQIAKMFFISVNYFCKTSTDLFVPAEFALVQYNLESGVQAKMHELINPVKLPLGLALEAKQYSEETHDLPLPPNALGETDLENVLHKILNFTDYNSKAQKKFPIITEEKQVPVVESVLSQCYEDSKDDYQFLVIPLGELFFHLKRATEKYGLDICTFPSKTMADILLKKDTYEYTSGIACDFHEKQGNTRFCALSKAVRWTYILSDNCCMDLSIDLIAGCHLPSNADTTLSLNMAETTSYTNQDGLSMVSSVQTNYTLPSIHKHPFRNYDDEKRSFMSRVAGPSKEKKKVAPTKLVNPFHMIDVNDSVYDPNLPRKCPEQATAANDSYKTQVRNAELGVIRQPAVTESGRGRGALLVNNSFGAAPASRRHPFFSDLSSIGTSSSMKLSDDED